MTLRFSILTALACTATAIAATLLGTGASSVRISSGTDYGHSTAGGIESILLPYDNGIRSVALDGSRSFNLLRLGHADGVGTTPETKDYGILGDPRMHWLSIPTTLDLVGNKIIDFTDAGNVAGLYNTRLVQAYCSPDLYLALATANSLGALKNRLTVNNYVDAATVTLTNVARLDVQGEVVVQGVTFFVRKTDTNTAICVRFPSGMTTTIATEP